MTEQRLSDVENAVRDMRGDLRYLREKLDGYFKTHDEVIVLKEKIKVANKRIQEIEDRESETQKTITAIMVKSAGVAALVSVLLGAVLKAGVN